MVVLAIATASSVASAGTYTFDASEAAFDAAYLKTPIAVTGKVVDASGMPVAGATIQVVGFGEAAPNNGRSGVTSAAGSFVIEGLVRRSVLLKIARAGHYTEVVPVDLQRPLAEAGAGAGTVVMTARKAGRARLVFVGDTMFGRRFTDGDEDGIEGEAGDLIRPGSRAADAAKVVAYVREAIAAADYAVANLECAVTADPATPHPTKSYTFFSHPDTLAGLLSAGFDAVDLANNHVFDYMGDGVYDSINAVAEVGLDWTGAEMNESAALDTTIHATPGGVPLALQGFSALKTDGSSLTKYLLVARDPSKPGALEASADNLADFLAAEVGASFAVPMIHGGVEYSSYPSNTMRAMFVSLVEQGAGLVVAHHTHTLQGVGLVDAGAGPRFVLMSLGNFIFDQSTFETTQSAIAIADVEATGEGGYDVARLQLMPVYVEKYVPKLLAGASLARAGRQLGHLSATLPKAPSGSGVADGLFGATVFPSGPRVVAVKSPSQVAVQQQVEALALPLVKGSTGAVEFARTGPADSLVGIQTGASAQAEWGREILRFGDFEDGDVDDAFSEGAAWDTSESRYVQNSVVRSGAGAAVLLRRSSNSGATSLANARTIPIPGGARLTIRGWVRGDNAGTFRLTTRIYEADGTVLSTVDRLTRSGGTYGWTPFSVDLVAPSGAGDLRIYFKQSPPGSGEGRVFVDDVSVILWEGKASEVKGGVSLAAPNDVGFVRFTGAAGSSLDVSLTHRAYTAL